MLAQQGTSADQDISTYPWLKAQPRRASPNYLKMQGEGEGVVLSRTVSGHHISILISNDDDHRDQCFLAVLLSTPECASFASAGLLLSTDDCICRL